MQQKKVGYKVIFFKTRARRVRGAYAPAGVRGQRPRAVFLCCFEAQWALIVYLKYHIKASVTIMAFSRENQIIPRPWQGVYFFYQHCFTKNIETQCSDGKHDKHHF